MAFVLMKIFEEAPRHFDRQMQVLTLGRLQQIRDKISSLLVAPDSRVLEIGCGTGALMEMLARRGASVVGIDAAESMIDTARRRLKEAGLEQRTEVKKVHALQLEDELEPESFDRIVSILVLSELSDDEIDCLLPQCRKVLKSGGSLILTDEVVPTGFFSRLVYHVYRHITRVITFFAQQAIELKKANFFLKILYFLIEFPLMLVAFLVVPPATHPIADFERRVERAGFRLTRSENYLGGSLRLIAAEAIP